MGDPKSFHYLNQSNCYELVGVNAAQDYLSTKRAMDIVGISQDEQVSLKHYLVFLIIHLAVFWTKLLWKVSYIFLIYFLTSSSQDAIFRVVAAILHLGNINFSKSEETDFAVLEEEESKFHLQTTAELLMYCWTFTVILSKILYRYYSSIEFIHVQGVMRMLWKMHCVSVWWLLQKKSSKEVLTLWVPQLAGMV